MSNLFDIEDGNIRSVGKFQKAYRDDMWRTHYLLAIRLQHLRDDIEMDVWRREKTMKPHIKKAHEKFMKDVERMISFERTVLIDRENELGLKLEGEK